MRVVEDSRGGRREDGEASNGGAQGSDSDHSKQSKRKNDAKVGSLSDRLPRINGAPVVPEVQEDSGGAASSPRTNRCARAYARGSDDGITPAAANVFHKLPRADLEKHKPAEGNVFTKRQASTHSKKGSQANVHGITRAVVQTGYR